MEKSKPNLAAVRGKAGEEAVCGYLEEKGFKVISRNFRKKGGEIDIIAEKGEDIIFCEVKTRKFGALDSGAGAMTKTKMRRVIETAEKFVADNPEYKEYYRRFDTAYVTVTNEQMPRVLDIEYYEGDFTALDLE